MVASKRAATRKLATIPTEFAENRQPAEPYLAIPLITSENRDYITCQPQPSSVISNNKIGIVVDQKHRIFGFLSSRVFTIWNKAVSGRLESRLNISITTTYNNFPFAETSAEQDKNIEQSVGEVLYVRRKYPNSSLADLYDPSSMPSELRKAHQRLDRAALAAYGLKASATDEAVLRELFRRYEELT